MGLLIPLIIIALGVLFSKVPKARRYFVICTGLSGLVFYLVKKNSGSFSTLTSVCCFIFLVGCSVSLGIFILWFMKSQDAHRKCPKCGKRDSEFSHNPVGKEERRNGKFHYWIDYKCRQCGHIFSMYFSN